MRIRIVCIVLLSTSLLFARSAAAMDGILLKARYSAVAGSDPEYGQGAIERNDLPHREIEHFVWLILVDPPGDVHAWESKLNEAVDRNHGSFKVESASDEEVRAVKSGKITLQR